MQRSSLKLATNCVHAGNSIDKETGAIRRPIYMNNSYKSLTFVAGEKGSSFGYARDGSANSFYLERKLLAIEGGDDCLVTASGAAAANSVFLTLLSAGDHIICSNPCYYSVHRYLKDHLSKRFGVELTFVNPTDIDSVKNAVKTNTKVIHIESPANPTTMITDIAEVAKIAKKAGAYLTIDNTWATPVLQRPLELGADLVIESLTKYINGHGDSLGGAVIGHQHLIDQIRVEGMVRLGQSISPFNAWLIMRGMSTLPLRMARHCESAMQIAEYLESHPWVEFVRYPGLKSHPQHELATRQMDGYSGMMNFRFKGSDENHLEFLKHLKLLTPAVSLGHDESLIFYHSLTKEDPWYEILKETTTDTGKGFLRFSVGLEDPEDLIMDIEQAITACNLKDK